MRKMRTFRFQVCSTVGRSCASLYGKKFHDHEKSETQREARRGESKKIEGDADSGKTTSDLVNWKVLQLRERVQIPCGEENVSL
jgi:hypothetical protein